MRKAFELAWSNAYCFSSIQPVFKAVDDISFVHPVSIGYFFINLYFIIFLKVILSDLLLK